MPYTFEKIFAADPERPELVASNGVITVFAPGDESKTPVAIKSATSGLPLPNPLQVNASGWGPALMHDTLDRLAWEGGGFSGIMTSYEGIKDEAVAARQSADESRAAAQEAAAEARAPADDAVARGLSRANLPGMIANGVAAQPAVAMAAAAAVEQAAQDVDIVVGEDSRIPVPIEAGTGWAHPFTDGAGRVAGGFTEAGVFRLAQPLDAPRSVASRTQVACIGDSLVRGYTGGTAWGLSEAWPAKLAELLPGVEVVNAGSGGNTVDDARFRVGALRMYAEIKDGVIPQSGPVEAIVQQRIGLDESRTNNYWGVLAGVRGDLTRTANGAWTFTRSSAGAAVPVQGKQLLVRDDLYPNHTAILWMGRNDVTYGAKGAEGDVVEHVLSSIVSMVEHLRPAQKQFLVVSVVNQSNERPGSARYEQIVKINDGLAALFPGRYMDVRSWMVKQAIYDAGLSPTAADREAMAADAPPPQIMDGGSHYNKEIAPLLAAKFADFLTRKGFC